MYEPPRAADKAAPLAFGIGTIALVFVALSFVWFSKRVAHAGSAYAYIGRTFGWRWGFVSRWTLLLTYLTYAAGVSALIGNFLQAAVGNLGTPFKGMWLAASLAGLVLAGFCAYRDVKLASRLMLWLEGTSVLVIVLLCIVILIKVGTSQGLSAEPFFPASDFKGWSGIGYALIFCVLSFAGFEGAATLDLAVRYLSRPVATAIDIAAAISAFSCVLGSLTAAARVLFALGRDRFGLSVGEVHPVNGTPSAAVIVSGVLCVAMLLLWAPFVGPADYCGYLVTIGSLALILVYIGVNAAELTISFRGRRTARSMCSMAGTSILFWPLYNSLYPVPAHPNNRWPYLVAVWVIGGASVPLMSPAIAAKDRSGGE